MQISTTPTSAKAAPGIFNELGKNLNSDGPELVQRIKGVVVFKVDGSEWTLDLSEGEGELYQGSPKNKEADLTLTISDANFVKLVAGKLNPQTAFMMRQLKIQGSMGMAMKLQPILDAAKPKSKL